MLTPSSQITIITTVPTTECSKTLPARKLPGKSSAVDVCRKSALSAEGGLNERPSDLSANLSRCHQLKLQPKSNSKPSLLTEHRHGSDVTVQLETLKSCPFPPHLAGNDISGNSTISTPNTLVLGLYYIKA